MNNKRRKEFSRISLELDKLLEELEDFTEEEENYIDAIPDNLQDSQLAVKAKEGLSDLNLSIDNLTDCIGAIQNVIES